MNLKSDDRYLYALGGAVLGVTLSRAYDYATKRVGEPVAGQSMAADSAAAFKSAGSYLIDWIVKYRRDCRSMPVISTAGHNYLQKVLPGAAPEKGEGWEAIFQDLDKQIVPGLTHWSAPNTFFAYFKPHSAYPAVLAETLCAGLNVMGFDWIASPACTELEVVTLDWLGKFLNLPDKFLSSGKGPGGAVIQGSAGESAIVVILAAILQYEKKCKGAPTNRKDLVVFGSSQTHTIIKKACRILGVAYQEIGVDETTDWSLQGRPVESAIQASKKSGKVPIVVVATAGTTSSCAFDDLMGIGSVCQTHGIWLHVDAAYGGAYACLPECAHLFKGLGSVTSFCVNAHKKLLCPFDVSALYLADRHPVVAALKVDSEYLRNEHSDSGAVVDFENWQLPLGRRFRALKLWFVMRRFGTEGLRKHVRKGIELRKTVEGFIQNEYRDLFEIAAKPRLSLVCFRLKHYGDETQLAFLQAIKRTQKCFIIHTKLNQRVVLRFACGGSEQTVEDVTLAWKTIRSVAQDLK